MLILYTARKQKYIFIIFDNKLVKIITSLFALF